MRRGGDFEARLARVERTMATQEDIEELRGLIEGRGPAGVVRRLGRTLLVAMVAGAFAALILAFTR